MASYRTEWVNVIKDPIQINYRDSVPHLQIELLYIFQFKQTHEKTV